MSPGTPPNPANDVVEATTLLACDGATTTEPGTPPKAALSPMLTTVEVEASVVLVLDVDEVVVVVAACAALVGDTAMTPGVPPKAPSLPSVNKSPPVAALDTATSPGDPPNPPELTFAGTVTVGSFVVVSLRVAVTITISVVVTVMVEAALPVSVVVVVPATLSVAVLLRIMGGKIVEAVLVVVDASTELVLETRFRVPITVLRFNDSLSAVVSAWRWCRCR